MRLAILGGCACQGLEPTPVTGEASLHRLEPEADIGKVLDKD